MKAVFNRGWAALACVIAGAAAFGWLFFTGEMIEAANERAALIAAIWRHAGYGVILSPLLVFYLFWRFKIEGKGFAWRRPSSLFFWAMFAIIVFLIMSGPLVVWTHGSPLKVFDWFSVANPIGKTPWLHDPLEKAHVMIASLAPYVFAADAGLFIYNLRASHHG